MDASWWLRRSSRLRSLLDKAHYKKLILAAEFPSCPSSPCIDPIFGPTAPFGYWSSSSATIPTIAWHVSFDNGITSWAYKTDFLFARAVRGGS